MNYILLRNVTRGDSQALLAEMTERVDRVIKLFKWIGFDVNWGELRGQMAVTRGFDCWVNCQDINLAASSSARSMRGV